VRGDADLELMGEDLLFAPALIVPIHLDDQTGP